MADQALLSTAQVAEILGTTVATVNRWVAAGKLPIAQQLPGRTGVRLYIPRDVEAFAKQRNAQPKKQSA